MIEKSSSKSSYRGKLIAVEGLDGSGKSTQIKLLRKWLELEGYPVFFTEWNSSPVVKVVTRKAKKDKNLSPTTFSLIHATDFADRYERQILPLLEAGFIVLCDRYFYTAYARDGVRKVNTEWLRKLYSFALQPDITFYFDVPTEVALGRILTGRPELKYHEAGMDLNLAKTEEESFKIFQDKIANEYKKLVSEFNLQKIDGTLPPREQQDLVREYLTPIINSVKKQEKR